MAGHTMSLSASARTLANAAVRLKHAGGGAPSLYFLTDRRRVPSPEGVIAGLPRGAAVILRDYDGNDRAALASRLAAICWARGVVFLVGADWRLAIAVRADGVHLPQALAHRLPGLRARRPDWWLTAAAHDAASVRRGVRLGADAIFLSPAFPTHSHPGAAALGPARFASLSQLAPQGVVALGGIETKNALRLKGARIAGLAAIGAFAC